MSQSHAEVAGSKMAAVTSQIIKLIANMMEEIAVQRLAKAIVPNKTHAAMFVGYKAIIVKIH